MGDGAGEAGRLDGLKNEGVLMACIVRGLEGRAVRLYVAVLGWRESEAEWWLVVSVYTVEGGSDTHSDEQTKNYPMRGFKETQGEEKRILRRSVEVDGEESKGSKVNWMSVLGFPGGIHIRYDGRVAIE